MDKLQHDILLTAASAVAVKRKALNALHPSPNYVCKAVSELYTQGLLRKGKGGIIRITQRGLDELGPEATAAWVRLSCGGAPGNDPAHMDTYCRAGEICAVMLAAGVSVPAQHKALYSPDFVAETEPAFYLLRELKGSPEQKKRRMTGSRASGILLSPTLTCTVISCGGRNIKLSRVAEAQESILAMSSQLAVSAMPVRSELNECLLIQPWDASLILRTERGTVAEAIQKSATQSRRYRMIPPTADGVRALEYILAHPHPEVELFSSEERKAAEGLRWIDAITNGVQAVEALSCNITKLRAVAGRTDVGVVCWEWQLDFLWELWGRKLELARAVK